ncbi:XRE family transcriptional regulator [Dactylosporangium sp. NPDC048998]|uniref:XRE family transcriptional regulator n=1 Tax=Dactylosporangium sp. NPDC048998 TaxID=3363976 RepID=UPI003720DF1C
MKNLPAFGVQLMRLAELRDLDVNSLARRATVAETEITSVLDGAEAGALLLRRLAPALDLHPSDLFVIAGRQVPDDLAPLDATASGVVGSLAWDLTYLPRAVPELRQLVDTLPQQPRPQRSPAATPSFQQYPSSAGGLVLRLLHNRNLNWLGAAKYLFGLGGGPMLSASTIGMIGRGEKVMTPELLAGYAAVLDVSSRDLGALTGIDLRNVNLPVHPDAAAAAALLWSARRLTVDQVRQVRDRAHAIRHERADELDPRLRCNCPGPT